MWLVVGVAIGAVLGIGLAALALFLGMRALMITTKRVPVASDELTALIERRVPGVPGWGMPIPSLDFHALLTSKGHAPEGISRIKLYFLCNGAYATDVVSADPGIAAMMPCTWAVIERADGAVLLSKFNIPLMSMMLRGPVGAAMAKVARDEEEMLRGI